MENPIKLPRKYILSGVAAAAIVILGVALFLNSEDPAASDTSATPAPQNWTAPSVTTATLPELSPEEAQEALASLKKMSQVLLEYGAGDKKLEDLLENLQQQGQEPFTVRDKNEYTGEMIIVRTKNPSPGTRYFHAQYFTDEESGPFPQHMSFEYRPSPQAMSQAIKAVQEAFPNLKAPTHQTSDFIQWDLENGHVLWIKRLGPVDIRENPFNAYTEADLGSIRVAVELYLEGH